MSTEQVKSAIKKLKNSGFDRSEFSVRVERLLRKDENGRQFYEYGKANIVIYANKEKQFSLIKNMISSGLTVCLPFYQKDGNRVGGYPIVNDIYTTNGIGRFIIWDDTQSDFSKKYQYIKMDDPRHPLHGGK